MSITADRPNAADKLRETLALYPASTTAELVEISGLSRATITKQLTALRKAGDVKLALSRFVGDVCHPATVGRNPVQTNVRLR